MNKHRSMDPTRLPSRQRGVSLLLVLLVLIIAAGAGGVIAYLVITRVDVTLLLKDQRAEAVIPQKLDGRIEVSDAIGLRLQETIVTQVPINQTVTIPVSGRVKAVANFDGAVPLKLQVHVVDEIQLNQVVNLDTKVDAYLPELGSTISIPLRGKIPINTVVPVDIVIPVDQMLPLKASIPLTASIDQDLTVPLRTTIDANVPVDANLRVPVLNALDAVVTMPTTPTDLVISEAALKLPLRTLKLGLNKDPNGETSP